MQQRPCILIFDDCFFGKHPNWNEPVIRFYISAAISFSQKKKVFTALNSLIPFEYLKFSSSSPKREKQQRNFYARMKKMHSIKFFQFQTFIQNVYTSPCKLNLFHLISNTNSQPKQTHKHEKMLMSFAHSLFSIHMFSPLNLFRQIRADSLHRQFCRSLLAFLM